MQWNANVKVKSTEIKYNLLLRHPLVNNKSGHKLNLEIPLNPRSHQLQKQNNRINILCFLLITCSLFLSCIIFLSCILAISLSCILLYVSSLNHIIFDKE